MNYEATELQHQLAARYVIGSMRGQARARFKRFLMEFPKLRSEVVFWEQHLSTLVEVIPARTPDAAVLKRIYQRLGWQTEAKPNWWQRWVGFGAATAVLLVMLVVGNIYFEPPTAPVSASRIAVIQGSDARTLWLIEQQQRRLAVKVVGQVELLSNEDYQLWMLPSNGNPPISLGLLPQQGEVVLELAANIALDDIAALAVSREPAGGSPIDVPTGPVLYTTDLVLL